MDAIKVSVVTITYNQEKYLPHTLESIVDQKVDFKIEALVGDDCSPDGTADVVRKYAEKYPDIIIPFIREKNLGMSSNEMDLIKRAKGEYIAFLEGDDYWLDEDKLQKQVDFLDAHPDYAACFGQFIVVDENDVRHPEEEQYKPYKKDKGDYTIREFEKYIFPGQTGTSMYRRSSFEKMLKKLEEIHFDLGKLVDVTVILGMLAFGKMYNLGEIVSAYRYVLNVNSGSWSSKNDVYSPEPLIKYLDGMKDMEKLAESLGLQLDFDERRTYEIDKLYDNKGTFNKKDERMIRKKIKDGYNSKIKYYKTMIKKMLKAEH